jgi:hypothetical protein
MLRVVQAAAMQVPNMDMHQIPAEHKTELEIAEKVVLRLQQPEALIVAAAAEEEDIQAEKIQQASAVLVL